MQRIALYDMDKTITVSPTWTPFLIETAATLAPWRLLLLPAAAVTTLGYALGMIDRGRLKEMTHRMLIGGQMDPARLATVAAAFAAKVSLRPGAALQIEHDRAAGYRIVMATASYRVYAQAIAERLGFDAVVGTEVQASRNGAILARIAGENCYGAAKLRMVESWFESQKLARGEMRVRCYSDHVSDVPVLAWADEAIAVNPHGALRRLAERRGWAIADWGR